MNIVRSDEDAIASMFLFEQLALECLVAGDVPAHDQAQMAVRVLGWLFGDGFTFIENNLPSMKQRYAQPIAHALVTPHDQLGAKQPAGPSFGGNGPTGNHRSPA